MLLIVKAFVVFAEREMGNKFYHINSPVCRTMKQVLDEYNIQYEEITDVEQIYNDGILIVPSFCWSDGTVDTFQTITKTLNC